MAVGTKHYKYDCDTSKLLKPLAISSSTSKEELCGKITALMTDSVSMNLHSVTSLNSVHVSFHLLCVSHTREVLAEWS